MGRNKNNEVIKSFLKDLLIPKLILPSDVITSEECAKLLVNLLFNAQMNASKMVNCHAHRNKQSLHLLKRKERATVF